MKDACDAGIIVVAFASGVTEPCAHRVDYDLDSCGQFAIGATSVGDWSPHEAPRPLGDGSGGGWNVANFSNLAPTRMVRRQGESDPIFAIGRSYSGVHRSGMPSATGLSVQRHVRFATVMPRDGLAHRQRRGLVT